MHPTSRRARRSLAVGTAIVAVFAATACGHDPDPDYQGVCVDRTTGQRSPDTDCDHDQRTHGILFFPPGARFPRIGQSTAGFTGGVATVPDGHNGVRGGAAAAGGVTTKAAAKSAVSRGGFGTTSHGHGWSIGG
jgi:hypothetical protein